MQHLPSLDLGEPGIIYAPAQKQGRTHLPGSPPENSRICVFQATLLIYNSTDTGKGRKQLSSLMLKALNSVMG